MNIFDIAAILIGLSALFGYLNHRFLQLPHTIGLVVIALAASLAVIAYDVIRPGTDVADTVTAVLRDIDFHDTLMHGMLSFLLFAGGLHVDFSGFRKQALPIALMATIGILISTFLVGWATWFLLGLFGLDMPFIWTLVFGALISPTDPVAVLGIFRTVEVPEALEASMAGESLFNDGVGVVVFTVVVAIAVGGSGGEPVTALSVSRLFLFEAAGGALLGLAAGYIGYRAMYHVDEHNLEVMITLAMVMVTYLVAIRLHMSGPIAMVVAGMFIGNRGMRYAVSDTSREDIRKFWSLLDEILNSVLFLLIGLEVLVIAERPDGIGAALLLIPVTVIARWAAVFVPVTVPANDFKATVLTITYAVVLFSIIVQGLTIKPLVERISARGDVGG